MAAHCNLTFPNTDCDLEVNQLQALFGDAKGRLIYYGVQALLYAGGVQGQEAPVLDCDLNLDEIELLFGEEKGKIVFWFLTGVQALVGGMGV